MPERKRRAHGDGPFPAGELAGGAARTRAEIEARRRQVTLGKEKPPPRVLLRNLSFILRTAPFAARKARRHFTDALRIFRALDAPSVVAWALMDLGTLATAQRKSGEARTHLEEARGLARSVGATGLLGRIDEALAVF